jgi:hypothetical protein
MNYKIFLVLFFLFIDHSFAQTVTYFIRYKNSIAKASVALKVTSQQISSVPNKTSPQKNYSIKHLANNLAADDEILSRIIKVEFTDQATADEYLQLLKSDNTVEYVQLSGTYKVESVPNDSLIGQQWALEKIDAFSAWDITTGSDKILLAIIDTGIEFFHPDLKNNIYYNPGETGIDQYGNDRSSNNLDDDNNGFVDDYMGWDFTDRVNLPEDTTVDIKGWDNYPYDPVRGFAGYHGTAVAGIACATGNNISGISGVAPGIKMLNLRAFDNTGSGEEDDVASAILYAVKMNVRVINMSFGDTKFSYVLRDVIRYAYDKGVILVGSSGNSDDADPHYPSGFDQVISVGNSTREDYYTGTYGSTLDMIAPGTSILSTDMDGKYSEISGTSAAAPHVAASAALILSVNSSFTNEEVKQILKSSSDDVGTPGWDIRTGAGRLNLNKALNILSPAKIGFNYPYQDFATLQDTLNINITVMSPYFVKYSLMYGSGLNPNSWIPLVSDAQYQVLNNAVHTLNTSGLGEGEYTLRLVVSLNTGNTTEERINFRIQRTAPVIELVGAGPVLLGEYSTIMGELYTSSLAVTRMYYGKKGTGEFSFITLDGFAPNTQFVKQLHYGFIPKQLVEPNTVYEIYFEAETPGSLKTILKNENGTNFEYITDQVPVYSSASLMPYSLPSGSLFDKPVNFLSGSNNEILFSSNSEKPDSLNLFYRLYLLENNSFTAYNGISNYNPVESGDFNGNGKTDLLSRIFPNAYISEQDQPNVFSLSDKFSKDTSFFYPVLAADINNDGRPEVFSNYYSTTTKIFEINDDLSLNLIGSVDNKYIDSAEYTGDSFYNKIFKYSVITADTDGDGIKEFWTIDYDGDLNSYHFSQGNIIKGDSLSERSFITGQNKIIAAGDYNGDGTDEIAVLYTGQSIASYFVLRILSFKNHHPEVLFEKVFIDQSAEYSGLFSESFQSLKFVDADNDGKAELILNIFPDVYVYKYSAGSSSIIYFDEGINSETIFAGDLNRNGVPEIGLQYADGFKFYEFTSSARPGVPGNLAGYSIDSVHIFLKWSGSVDKYLVYKGTEKNSVALYDSTGSPEYYDNNATPNRLYYYAARQVDDSKEIPVSELSNIIEVYAHTPAAAVKAEAGSNKSILLQFSEKINSTVNNLRSFEVAGYGYPNSVSAASEYSYFISFSESFPAGNYKIIIKDLRDYYGSFIKQDTLAFEITPAVSEPEFFIVSHAIRDPFNITLSFNDDVNESDVPDVSNYVFEPENHIAAVTVDPNNKKIIYLSLLKERPVGSIGREYRLKVNNIRSAGGIKINEGAGSYVVLTGYSESLSDVYVYPSPVKIKSGEEKMMFANLPKRADIVIFNLDGKQLYSLEERDGNGGVEYNLKDNDNNSLSSGIYIYRIIRLDDNNNEVEEKIGKFAVIR